MAIKLYIGNASDITARLSSADYTNYSVADSPLVFVDDLKTGGSSGDAFGNDLTVVDHDGLMPIPADGQRVLIFDDSDPDTILFSGVISLSERSLIGVDGTTQHYKYTLQVKSFQWEADAIGIEEEPVYNVNAGTYLRQLMEKYTLLEVGEIDESTSPIINFIRLSNFRRFSTVGADLSAIWPGSEFFIESGETSGKVYFRQAAYSNAPVTLDPAFIQTRGTENVKITIDQEKQYNIVRMPFYKDQLRDPDYFVQDIVTDPAFLRTSVTLNGQPSGIEQSVLLLEDFSNGPSTDFSEFDLDNPAPPEGFSNSDGYLLSGTLNTVDGLHMLDTSRVSPAVQFGDIGLVTDPSIIAPFTGVERQTILAQELVIDQAGDAIVLGIVDPTTQSTITTSGSTGTTIRVLNNTIFRVDDRITISGTKTYVTSIGTGFITVSPAITPPAVGITVSKHALALSRVKFGVLFKANGDLKYINNGVETAFPAPRTYEAGPTTYSLRLFMQCFETTISGGISATGCTLSDPTNFSTNDVVEIFTLGSRNQPETRAITLIGSDISYTKTNNIPSAGYRIRTKPKIVLQIKGGAYGAITGRDWTTIYTAQNTWQTQAAIEPIAMGVLAVMPKSMVGTLSLFEAKNPPGITANIGGRYLHIGTQEVETSDPDTDCIIRKVGSHYQLDFFPDTKQLWDSGSRLELRYSEKFEWHLEDRDTDSMRKLAMARGQIIPDNVQEDELARLGGKALDTVELLPNPISLPDAINQSQSILDAVKDPAVTLEFITDTSSDPLIRSGQIIKSSLSDVPDLVVQKVTITEFPGANNNGKALFAQSIVAGSMDRLSDVLLRRKIKNGSRLVIDDGLQTDSFTKIQKASLNEKAKTQDLFEVFTCESPSNIVFSGSQYALLRCLLITPPADPAPPEVANAYLLEDGSEYLLEDGTVYILEPEATGGGGTEFLLEDGTTYLTEDGDPVLLDE